MRNAVLAIMFFSIFACAQDQRHPFTFDDAANLHSAAAVAISPDGKEILYRVRYGGAKGPDKIEWHMIPIVGGESRHLMIPETFKPAGFTRDGSALYGLYEVDHKLQVATFPLAAPNTAAAAAATPTPLTALPRGVHSAHISPDGAHYAILADPRLPDPLAEVHTIIEAEPTSLYVIAADGSGGGWWCGDLHNIGEISWSEDGSSIAVLSQTPKIGFHYVRSFIDVCSANGAKHIATIDNAAQGIGWIDGGKDLVFLSTTTPVLTPDHVWTVSAGGGNPTDRTPKLDGSAEQLHVDTRGNAWVTVAHGVHSDIESFGNGSLASRFSWAEGAVFNVISPQIGSAPDVHAFTVGDPQHASNVAVAHDQALQRITTEGDDLLAKTALGEVRDVHWTNQDKVSKENIPLEGVATFPSDYQAGKKYPFLILPHGGPEANDSFGFDMFTRIIAGMGYVVLQPEYRGSTGYGSEFLGAIYQHFGDRAYSDVNSGTDFAIAEGWADPNRLAIFGWSAGGFMTSWTVTQTNRYKAAIEGAGITDWLTFIWTSDVQQIDYDARWTDKDPNAFFAFSAMMHSEGVTTPLLILHGAADERVPTYQGREYFEILAARGKTTRLVEYPGSPHFPTVWEQRQDVFREIGAWLAKYNP
ncbi:MAG TPA: prolyl oligopeptidase family serine peptidase [Verrucomicrobiae bacterium]|nr:prolyl oligopeptidase family serine peptidase [Verrucomicrobiae bacterium]